jgi:hypothetical protein
MANELQVTINASGLKPMLEAVITLSNKLDRVTAVAMTRSAKKAQLKLKEEIPRYIDKPTNWTRNATFLRPAKENRLVVTVGFKDWSSTGVPAAKYINPQVAGGLRSAKPFESRLRAAGLLGSNQYAVPTGNAPLKLNSYGNISGPSYVQLLSRLNAMRESGYSANRTGSARSTAKRRNVDYFVAEINGNKALWARKGKNNRGIVPVFHFIGQAPSYQKRFPVPKIILGVFNASIADELEKAVKEEISYQNKKK